MNIEKEQCRLHLDHNDIAALLRILYVSHNEMVARCEAIKKKIDRTPLDPKNFRPMGSLTYIESADLQSLTDDLRFIKRLVEVLER